LLTSNPSAGQIQHHGLPPLFEQVARLSQTWGDPDQIGLVVGATRPDELALIRKICPQTWILAPGVGAQGADLNAALQAGLRSDGSGLIIPVSRGVITAADPRVAAIAVRDVVREEQAKLKTKVKEIHVERTDSDRIALQTGCIKFGDFLLASGRDRPFISIFAG
jgi:uridine monophosphate synthetase